MTLIRYPQIWFRSGTFLKNGEGILREIALLFLRLAFRLLLSLGHHQQCHETDKVKFKNQNRNLLWILGDPDIRYLRTRIPDSLVQDTFEDRRRLTSILPREE